RRLHDLQRWWRPGPPQRQRRMLRAGREFPGFVQHHRRADVIWLVECVIECENDRGDADQRDNRGDQCDHWISTVASAHARTIVRRLITPGKSPGVPTPGLLIAVS